MKNSILGFGFVLALVIATIGYILIVSKSDSQYLVSYSLGSATNQTLANRVFVAKELSVNEINKMKLLLEAEQTNSTVVILSIYKLQ